jgi:hypothetical protein
VHERLLYRRQVYLPGRLWLRRQSVRARHTDRSPSPARRPSYESKETKEREKRRKKEYWGQKRERQFLSLGTKRERDSTYLPSLLFPSLLGNGTAEPFVWNYFKYTPSSSSSSLVWTLSTPTTDVPDAVWLLIRENALPGESSYSYANTAGVPVRSISTPGLSGTTYYAAVFGTWTPAQSYSIVVSRKRGRERRAERREKREERPKRDRGSGRDSEREHRQGVSLPSSSSYGSHSLLPLENTGTPEPTSSLPPTTSPTGSVTTPPPTTGPNRGGGGHGDRTAAILGAVILSLIIITVAALIIFYVYKKKAGAAGPASPSAPDSSAPPRAEVDMKQFRNNNPDA